jgi:predicted anti-sigma-YlaC factor YlaD
MVTVVGVERRPGFLGARALLEAVPFSVAAHLVGDGGGRLVARGLFPAVGAGVVWVIGGAMRPAPGQGVWWR